MEEYRLESIDDIIDHHARARLDSRLPSPAMTAGVRRELRDIALPFYLGFNAMVHRIERDCFREHVDIGGEG